MKRLTTSFAIGIVGSLAAIAQDDPAEKAHLDHILERRTFTSAETDALNQDDDPAIDVRDLVIYLSSGEAISASFESAETVAFHSAGSVTLPIFFSKPVPSATTIKFDLGGNAIAPGTIGSSADYSISYLPNVAAGAQSHQLTIDFEPWSGIGGEKVIRLTINRDPDVLPNNGSFSTHIVRVRQFDSGEFVGSLAFSGVASLSAVAVRVGLESSGDATISFQPESAILGEFVSGSWSAGFNAFPTFTAEIPLTIPGSGLGRSEPINATLSFTRKGEPFSAEDDAYLEGFASDAQPAIYSAHLAIHDLYAAGNNDTNAFTIIQTGRLALQSVEYLDSNDQ